MEILKRAGQLGHCRMHTGLKRDVKIIINSGNVGIAHQLHLPIRNVVVHVNGAGIYRKLIPRKINITQRWPWCERLQNMADGVTIRNHHFANVVVTHV